MASSQSATPADQSAPPAARRTIPLRPMCADPHECSPAVRMQVLHQVPLFADLDDTQLHAVNARMTSLAWSEDQFLYRAGDDAEHLYIVASGRAKTTRLTPEGVERVTDILAPGDLFGGLHTLGQTRYPESVVAMTTICALRIGAQEFREILLEHSTVAVRALEMTAGRLAAARDDLTSQGVAPVAQRVAVTLLRLARKLGQRRPDGSLLIEVPLSRADIAAMAGSTPESVSRTMSSWRREGVIDSGRRWTALLQPDRLREIADAA